MTVAVAVTASCLECVPPPPGWDDPGGVQQLDAVCAVLAPEPNPLQGGGHAGAVRTLGHRSTTHTHTHSVSNTISPHRYLSLLPPSHSLHTPSTLPPPSLSLHTPSVSHLLRMRLIRDDLPMLGKPITRARTGRAAKPAPEGRGGGGEVDCIIGTR